MKCKVSESYRYMDLRTYLTRAFSAEFKTGQFGSLTSGMLSSDVLNSISLFNSADISQLGNIDIAKLLNSSDLSEAIGENASVEDEALASILKSFMDIEEVHDLANTNGDTELTEQEAMAFLQQIFGNDGDKETFSLDDMNKVLEKLGVDVESVLNKALEDAFDETKENEVEDVPEEEKTNNVSSTPTSSPSGGGSAGGVNGAGSSGNRNNTRNTQEQTADTVEQIQAQIDEKNGEIDEIEAQAEADIQEQEQTKADLMKQNGVSEDEYKAYEEQEQKLDEQISGKEQEIDEQDKIISDAQSTIDSNNNYIKDLDAQINSNQEALNSIASDDENASSRRTEIQNKISQLTREKEEKEAENKRLEDETIKNAETKKEELQNDITTLDAKKAELLNKTLSGSANFAQGMPASEKQKLTDSIRECDSKISEIRAQKEHDIATIRTEITQLEVKLKDAQAQEERNTFLKENSVNDGQAIVDFATQFDGTSSSEMYRIMREAGCRVDEGQWCADFVYFALSQTVGKENLPDWYTNCNTAGCTSVYNAASNAGAVIDQSQVQPGDVVLFSKDGGSSYYHTGIVTSIDDDGTLHTMEGNTWTSNENWGAWQRTYNMNNGGRTYTFVSMS